MIKIIAGIKEIVQAKEPSFIWTKLVRFDQFLAGAETTLPVATHLAMTIFCDHVEDLVAVRTLAEEQLGLQEQGQEEEQEQEEEEEIVDTRNPREIPLRFVQLGDGATAESAIVIEDTELDIDVGANEGKALEYGANEGKALEYDSSSTNVGQGSNGNVLLALQSTSTTSGIITTSASSPPPCNNPMVGPERPAVVAAAPTSVSPPVDSAALLQEDDSSPTTDQQDITKNNAKAVMASTTDNGHQCLAERQETLTEPKTVTEPETLKEPETATATSSLENELQYWKVRCGRLALEKDCQDIAICTLRDLLGVARAENRQLLLTTKTLMPPPPPPPPPPRAFTTDLVAAMDMDGINALVEESKIVFMAVNQDLDLLGYKSSVNTTDLAVAQVPTHNETLKSEEEDQVSAPVRKSTRVRVVKRKFEWGDGEIDC
jgi:hypothetical protein